MPSSALALQSLGNVNQRRRGRCPSRYAIVSAAGRPIGRCSGRLRLQWLIDRAEIAECLVNYARDIDRRDWRALQDSYTESDVMQPGEASVPRKDVSELSEKILAGCAFSHHLVDDPSIVIGCDGARTHSHYLASHISEGTAVRRQGCGWYDCDLERTERGVAVRPREIDDRMADRRATATALRAVAPRRGHLIRRASRVSRERRWPRCCTRSCCRSGPTGW
ncbi:MAG: nuclear transport factor 2 family protein [Candidatus Dormibacteraeota bacterium]|uniref:Nuclear transport factor 2 family protein n=1 Tax=Candidatus Amunia macphersoniae TaxID=3127014 RepID=A0A934NFK5_9BACT|nr:nuclear transport factor 2 family protein [Candidatus Dormibacteraeota bacterium]